MPETKLILNGWISPEGEIYECEQMHHMDVAGDIAYGKGLITDSDLDYDVILQQHRYIKFFNPCDDIDDIFYVLDPQYKADKIDPTQQQILAMGRLEKAIFNQERKRWEIK